MDERQYKSTYKDINPKKCVFEKAINSRVCNCSKAQRFNLADREGVACTTDSGLQRCVELISELRNNARFVFQRTELNQVLAHTEEIKIQNGGLIGLQFQVCEEPHQNIDDINQLITIAEEKFKNLANFPYSQLMKDISSYQARSRRRKTQNK